MAYFCWKPENNNKYAEKSLASDIYQHIMAWKCTKNGRTKYGASLFFLSLHEI